MYVSQFISEKNNISNAISVFLFHFHLSSLHPIAHHDHDLGLLLPDHPPEEGQSRPTRALLGQGGSLRGDVGATPVAAVNKVCVDELLSVLSVVASPSQRVGAGAFGALQSDSRVFNYK